MRNTSTTEDILNAVERPLNKLLSNKYWVIFGVLSAFILAAFFYVGLNHYFPILRLKGLYLHSIGMSTKTLGENGYPIYYGEFVQKQAIDLFAKHDINPNSHESQMVFRLTLPLLVKIFNFNILGLFLFQFFVIGSIYYSAILKLSYQIFKEKTLAFYFLLGILGIYMGNVSYYDVAANGDIMGYCFLVLAILYRNPVLIFLFSQVAFWTDERAIINSSFLVIWWFFEESESFKLKNLRKSQVLSVFVSWIVYFSIRFGLQQKYNLSNPIGEGTGVNMGTFFSSFNFFGAKLWQAYEAYLFMLVILIYILYKNRSWTMLFGIVFSFLIALFVALIVIDTTRSLSYTIILMFIAAKILKKTLEPTELRYLLASLAFISVVYPTFF